MAVALKQIRHRLRQLANPEKARVLRGFFKTGPGEYGEGDHFLGITVPTLRGVARDIAGDIRDRTLTALLRSILHEERLLALLTLVRHYRDGTPSRRQRIFELYRTHTHCVNNWDLVDLSASNIVGAHLATRDRQPLHDWARSELLWERRIAIVATFHFIRQADFTDTLALADILLHDPEDLMQKATGWMLREVGKRDHATLETFLLPRYHHMPRTMLRYAIERFPEPRRQAFLKGNA